jgi:hypothetical protein
MNGDDALIAAIRALGAEIHRLREIIWCRRCGYDGGKGVDWYCGKCVEKMDEEFDAVEGKLEDPGDKIATPKGKAP